MIFFSVVIDSYQVPRAAKVSPWLARHGHNVLIILQLANNAYFQPVRVEINFRSIVPIFLFSICRLFNLLSGHRKSHPKSQNGQAKTCTKRIHLQ